MSPVFLDTVGLLALWDADDQWHAAAQEAFVGLGNENALPMSTSFVLLECANAAARRPFRQAVERLREQLESAGALVFPTNEDWHDAWAAYRVAMPANPASSIMYRLP
jgi:uncharacterized protein